MLAKIRTSQTIKALGLILLAVVLVSLLPIPIGCSWDFRNCLWGPAYMLVHGQSPYSPNMPYGPYPPSWFPMATGALFYLGWLPCVVASRIWLLSELAGLGIILWLLWGRSLPPPKLFLISLLSVVLFPPLYLHFKNGQFTILFIALMMIAVFLPAASRYRPLLLAIGLTKPQLGFLIYPGLLLAEYRDNGIKGASRLVLQTALCAALLTVPLFIAYPKWPGDLVRLLTGYAGQPWDTPVLFSQLPVLIGPGGRALWVVIFFSIFTTALILWWRTDSKTALVWSLLLTPIATPYTWSYDFVMLLPVLNWLLVRLHGKFARAILIVGSLMVYVFIILLRWKNEISDGQQWWVPTALLIVYLAALLAEHRRNRGWELKHLER